MKLVIERCTEKSRKPRIRQLQDCFKRIQQGTVKSLQYDRYCKQIVNFLNDMKVCKPIPKMKSTGKSCNAKACEVQEKYAQEKHAERYANIVHYIRYCEERKSREAKQVQQAIFK